MFRPRRSKLMNTQEIQSLFSQSFSAASTFVVRAPGRVNLIGEHTDYNDGFVFPAAINFDVTIAGAPRDDNRVRAYSVTFQEFSEFELDNIKHSQKSPWCNYIRGVALSLQKAGFPIKGMNIAVAGDVPIGSGLSSSAALEVASCLAFEVAGGFDVDPVKRALLGQQAEREFVGVNCGIMDQFISSLGRKAHALFIDTRTLGYESVPLPEKGISIVISNTNKARGLVDSEYNTRRAECEKAVEILKEDLPDIIALRDVTSAQLTRLSSKLPERVLMRARHVITEDERVLESITALKSGDIARFGVLMNESHDSLRDDYQVSCKELDIMVNAARKVEGVYGSRMTGAGFGGCTVSLVKDEAVEEFKRAVGAEYKANTGLAATFYVSTASNGAERLV